MQGVTVRKFIHVDVDTPEVEPRGASAVEVLVNLAQDHLTRLDDRAIGQSDEVKIADPRDVVAGGQGAGHEQIEHPSDFDQTVRQSSHSRGHGSHAVTLGPAGRTSLAPGA